MLKTRTLLSDQGDTFYKALLRTSTLPSKMEGHGLCPNNLDAKVDALNVLELVWHDERSIPTSLHTFALLFHSNG